MPTDVIVLNGGSSSGKTTIALRLQEMLPGIWLSLGVDDLIAALPTSSGENAPIALGADGSVLVRESFRRAEAAWWAGVAAMARSGVGVIVDDAFLGGAASPTTWWWRSTRSKHLTHVLGKFGAAKRTEAAAGPCGWA